MDKKGEKDGIWVDKQTYFLNMNSGIYEEYEKPSITILDDKIMIYKHYDMNKLKILNTKDLPGIYLTTVNGVIFTPM